MVRGDLVWAKSEETWSGRSRVGGMTVWLQAWIASCATVRPAIAQLAEHLTVDACSDQMVPGSIPGGRIFCCERWRSPHIRRITLGGAQTHNLPIRRRFSCRGCADSVAQARRSRTARGLRTWQTYIAPCGIRTHDLPLTDRVLCQLSKRGSVN